jgi:hypothetical protein
MSPLLFIDILTHTFDPWGVVSELWDVFGFVKLPYVGVKSLKIRVENRLMVLYQL